MQIIKYLVLCYKMFYHNNNNNNIISFDNLEFKKYTILPHLLRNTIFERLLDPHNYIFDFCYKLINNFLTIIISIRRF